MRKSWPQQNAYFFEIEVKHNQFTFVKLSFVLIVDDCHQEDRIDVKKLGCSIVCEPFKIVVDDLRKYLIEDVSALNAFNVEKL